MRFGITRIALGKHAFAEISAEKFNEIVGARKIIIQAVGIEEKYDILLENFRDYELALIEAALENMCFPGTMKEAMQRLPVSLNRKLANLLSSARSYINQLPRHFQETFGKDSPEANSIKEKFPEKYDLVLGYRTMEALRNFAQHRALPIQSVGLGMKWVGDEPENKLQFSSSIYLMPKELQEDGKFKKTVLKELLELGDKVELKELVRAYVGALSDIHQEARDIFEDAKKSSEETILQALEDFKLASPEKSTVGVGAVVENDDLTWRETVHLPSATLERLTYFIEKNQQLSLLSKFYVSSISI